MYLKDKDIINFQRTCKKYYNLIEKSSIYKMKCLNENKIYFDRGLNRVFENKEDELFSWKLKFILNKFLPTKMKNKEIDDCVVEYKIPQNDYFNVLSDHPFISCNRNLLTLLNEKQQKELLFRGKKKIIILIID